VTPCSFVVGYQGFRGPCYLRLHPEFGGMDHKTWNWNSIAVKASKLAS